MAISSGFPADVAKALSRLRRRKGWTQAKLAEAVGMKPPNISDYERGVSGMLVETLGRLLDAMGFTIGDLAEEMGESPDLRRLATVVDRLDYKLDRLLEEDANDD